MPNPQMTKLRMEQAEARSARRQNAQPEFRSIEALELIADTLIDLRDVMADIRLSVELISRPPRV